jgi:Putative metal-binding motif
MYNKYISFIIAWTLLLSMGCDVEVFNMGENGSWVRDDAGEDVSPDSCEFTSEEEICDGIDNNCDGVIDEGFNLATNPRNCGECGVVCEYSHAEPICIDGDCLPGDCIPGYWDINGDSSDDCEYNCHITNDGVESCDSKDNDCNGEVDEGTDLLTDTENCGSCEYNCSDHMGSNQVVGQCSQGICKFDCVAGWIDVNGDLEIGNLGDGCEDECSITNGGDEICDNVDNDCDGKKDEDISGAPLSQSCYSGPSGTENEGICLGGVKHCYEGTYGVCEGDITPQDEICDTIDNNCDGSIDETYDLNTDINNCGNCNESCWNNAPANAYPTACNMGSCEFSCNLGYGDLNDDINTLGGDGCLYECPVYPPVVEYCDGIDNNCDGNTDEDLTPPDGICYEGVDGGGVFLPGSNENNPCSGVVAVCTDPDGTGILTVGWYCDYPAIIDTVPGNPNIIVSTESLCDGYDNDCDGVADDDFSVGMTCYSGIGGCRMPGELVCTVDMASAKCDATPGVGQNELCDGIDNDCDGSVDEIDPSDPNFHLYGDFVYINSGDFTIFAFEASRSSADATTEGFGDVGSPCSVKGVMPWSSTTPLDATPFGESQVRDICQRLGSDWDLCTNDQWYMACSGGALPSGGDDFPYGITYDATTCNGVDYGIANGGVYPRPTGELNMCMRTFDGSGVFDMSGNLKEWVLNGSEFELMGGSYNNLSENGTAPALQCNGVSPIEAGAEIHLPSIGFRCCYNGDLFN